MDSFRQLANELVVNRFYLPYLLFCSFLQFLLSIQDTFMIK